jgi:hypothetical protein
MNNPNNMLIIESRSNYAFQLRGKNLSFSEIRNTSTAFFTSLPEDVRNELYNNMCHGTIKLDCEPELNAYMYAFGAMHNAKLKDAFSHLSTNFFNEREIDIIDYGCGQAMGCISYADYLRENNHTQNVRRITLIEPSYIALARAALHSSLLFPNAEIVTINKGFDDLTVSDIEVDTNIPTLHIFSNVLDMGSTPNYNGVFNFDCQDKMISGVPFFLVFGLCACCHAPLCHSIELVLAPDPSPDAGVSLILKNKVNHVMAGRLLVEALLRTARAKDAQLSYIKSIMYGGEETNKKWENNILHELEKICVACHKNWVPTKLINNCGKQKDNGKIQNFKEL